MINIDSFQTNKKDITILWESQRDLSADILSERLHKGFPSFNVEISNENNELIYMYEHIPSSNEIGSISLASLEARQKIINRNPAIICANPRKKIEMFSNQNIVKNNFTFPIEENFRLFKEKNGYDGFYEKLFIKITHNDSFQISYTCFVEYDKTINKDLLNQSISKVYRSSDNLNLKIKFNPSSFNDTNINSFIIFAKAINGNSQIDLSPVFVEDVQSKWLDTVDDTKILSLPFIENEILEESQNLNIEIYPLLPFETAVLKSIKDNENIKNFINNFIINKLVYNNLYKSGSILELINFHGYVYLFNKESFSNLAWPDINLLINNINYYKYFPKSKGSNNLNTICLNTGPEIDSSILEIVDQNLNQTLGYYNIDESKYYDILLDLPYFKSLNISHIKIIEIEEKENEYVMYLDFTTLLTEQQDIILYNCSSNLSYIRKYYENINDSNYLHLIFSIKYPKFNKDGLNSAQVIDEKIMINFSFRYNN